MTTSPLDRISALATRLTSKIFCKLYPNRVLISGDVILKLVRFGYYRYREAVSASYVRLW